MSVSTTSTPGTGGPAAEKIIVALDRPDAASALALVASIPDLRVVKVGLELFCSAGPEVVRQLSNESHRIRK